MENFRDEMLRRHKESKREAQIDTQDKYDEAKRNEGETIDNIIKVIINEVKSRIYKSRPQSLNFRKGLFSKTQKKSYFGAWLEIYLHNSDIVTFSQIEISDTTRHFYSISAPHSITISVAGMIFDLLREDGVYCMQSGSIKGGYYSNYIISRKQFIDSWGGYANYKGRLGMIFVLFLDD